MSLSKKNLNKLNEYQNKNLNNNINYTNSDSKDNSTKNSLRPKDPNKIFYSLIENSKTLEDTSKVNHLLRNSEIDQINMNSKKTNYFNKLTIEDELYDEFNYLLDE